MPGTFDYLREPMIINLINRAKENKDIQVIFRGNTDLGECNIIENVIFKPQTETIEEDMKDRRRLLVYLLEQQHLKRGQWD